MVADGRKQGNVAIDFDHEWRPVLALTGARYVFPNPIGTTKQEPWNKPAVYRWLVFEQEPGEARKLYIGGDGLRE